MPTGVPFAIDVTTVTPVQNRPSTSRKCRASVSAAGSSLGSGVSSPSRNSNSWLPRNWSISSAGGQLWAAAGSMPSGGSRCDGRPKPCGDTSAPAEDVAPVADGGGLAGDPLGVVDGESLAPVLNVEPSRGLHVERHHLVVHVPTQGRAQRN